MARKELVTRILQQYGLDARTVADAKTGYRSESYALTLHDGSTANLILYKRETGITTRIANANRVGDYLALNGLPARQTLDPRVICLKGANSIQYGAIYTYLPGTTIPWEAYTKEHLKQLGGAMGVMHATLGGLPRGSIPSVAGEYLDLLHRMSGYFSQTGVKTAMIQKLGLLPPDLTPHTETIGKYSNTAGQALHMDFVRGNVLFQSDPVQLTGILDFEKAAWGPVEFDIARTLSFLLVDCKYKQQNKIWKYFMHSGYNKRGRVTYNDWQSLEKLIDICLLHDLYKFLLHNPYEALLINEHYTRTTMLLIRRKLISQA